MHLFPSMGNISAMTDSAHPPQTLKVDLHQLQVHKLLQYKDLVVCPQGLNGQMEASQFTFKELPLWDTATPCANCTMQTTAAGSGPQCSMQPEGVTTTIQTPSNLHQSYPLLADTTEPSGDITAIINLQLTGCYGVIVAGFPCQPSLLSPGTAYQGNSHHLQIWVLCQQLKNWKTSFRPDGMDYITSVPVGTFTPTIMIVMQMSPQVPIPAGTLSFAHITPQILQLIPVKDTAQMMHLPFYHMASGPCQEWTN